MKNRTGILSGMALFVCFCVLSASGQITGLFSSRLQVLGLLLAEFAAFFLPTLLIKVGENKDDRVALRLFPKTSVGSEITFTVCAALTLAIGTFLLRYAAYRLFGVNLNLMDFAFPEGSLSASWLAVALVVVLLAPILEELFLRGAVFSAHRKSAGTLACILASGVCYAMLYSSLENFIAPMIAGMLYAYLTYEFDSIWPAVLAHFLYNIYYLFARWITDTYSAFGIWKYFPIISLLFFLLFLYLALRSLETLIATDHLRRLKKKESPGKSFMGIVCNPGFIVFVLAFLAKAVFKLV